MKINTFAKVILIGALITYAGYTYANEKNAAKYSDALIVVSNAEDVYYDNRGGYDQVLYIVKNDYPASSVLKEISDKLSAKGWKPLSEDYLNPGLPTSHVRGWTDFIDAQKKPHKKVHQWLAQWENSRHDILMCNLRYTYPENGRVDLKSLSVAMAYIPAKVAIESKKQLKEFSKKKEKESQK